MLPLHAMVGTGAILTATVVIVGYLAVSAGARAYLVFRGQRVVTCPETGAPAGVEVDASHAALTSYRGRPDLRLWSCSRWPEREGCGQECLRQIESAPTGCLVRSLLDAWYQGRQCVFCGRRFGTIHWHDHKPALLTPEGKIVEWRQIAAEDVPGALESDRPVCWNCEIAETFRSEHPDLVVDRPARHDQYSRGSQW